jgi:hypothetical protein
MVMLTIKGGMPDFNLLAPLNTDADLLNRVDQVISHQDRRGRSLWLMFLSADAVQLPVAVPIDDVPAEPGPDAAGCIGDLIAGVLKDAAPGGSAVITLVREGGGAVTDSDQRWLVALHGAAAHTDVRLRMICLATEDGIRRLEPPAGFRSGPEAPALPVPPGPALKANSCAEPS